MKETELTLIERITDSLNESMISHAEMVHATPEFELSIKRAFALHDFSYCITEYVISEEKDEKIKIDNLRNSLNTDNITEYVQSIKKVYPGYDKDPLNELIAFFSTESFSDDFACFIDMHMAFIYDSVQTAIYDKYCIETEFNKDLTMYSWLKSELVLFGSLRIDLRDIYPKEDETKKECEYGIGNTIVKYIKPYVLWYYRHNILRKFSELGYMFNVIDPLQFDIILPEPEMDDEMPNIDDDFGDESDSEDVDDMDFDPVEEFDDETDGND